ncbi:HNH endonuclease signature motif containing protein, partial [Actinomycetospora succinea]
GPDDDGPDDDGPDDDGPDDDGPDDDGPDDDGPDDDGPDDPGPVDPGPVDPGPDDGPDDTSPVDPGPVDPGPDDGSGDGPGGGEPRDDGPGDPGPSVDERRAGRLRRGTVEVRLRLTTALGLDEHPATVPGFGTVTASTARRLVGERQHGEWRVVLTDPGGYLQHVLLARRRPARSRGRHPTRGRTAPGATRTRAIVELQVPTTLLAALDPDDHPPWAGLITELQQRLHDLRVDGGLGRAPDADAGPEEWRRRRARAEAERWVRVRDRCCVVPGCRRPAHLAEIDHTRDHILGGPTVSWNLGPWCTHHHRAKHLARWRVRQPWPGRFVIRTRAGVTHTTWPKKVLKPLPGPCYAAAPRALPDDGWPDRPADEPDRGPDRRDRLGAEFVGGTKEKPAPTPAASYDPDDPPPF